MSRVARIGQTVNHLLMTAALATIVVIYVQTATITGKSVWQLILESLS